MSDDPSHSHLPAEVLAHLQEAMLKAVLLNEPLPGGQDMVMFPDLAFVLRQPTIILVDENLMGHIAVEGSPKAIRVLSREALLRQARDEGDVVYLRFQPARREGDALWLTLEAKIASPDPRQPTLGLSGMQARFQEKAGQWGVVEVPIFFAA